jgi:hypothetical protein
VLRVGRTSEPRWWLLAGAVLGVGLANKHNVGSFARAIVIGLLVSGGRRLVVNWWFLAGALVAAAFTVPNLWWQAHHGWPTVAMTRQLNRENGGVGNIATWIVGQLLIASLALLWVWTPACASSGARDDPRRARSSGRTGCCSRSSPSRPERRSTPSPAPTSTWPPPAPSQSTAGWRHERGAGGAWPSPYRIHNQEWHGHIYSCTDLHTPWATLWPTLRSDS